MTRISWDSRLATVANRSASKIEKAFGFRTVGDLLQHYPRRYEEKGRLSSLDAVQIGDHVTVIGRVVSSVQREFPDRRRGGIAYRLEAVVATEKDQLGLTFFDKRKSIAQWRARSVAEGATGLFSGKVGEFRGERQLTNPQTRMFVDTEALAGEDQATIAWQKVPELIPIYPATASISSWQIADTIGVALDLLDRVPDVLPERVRREQRLLDVATALELIHRPETWPDKTRAEQRLRFDEAFVTQTVLAQRRATLAQMPAQPRTGRPGGLLDQFDGRLPFTLTRGQQRVGADILADLALPHPMHRLLEGEVGSGKTVVALRAMLRVIDSGGQAALLAPTEVLAAQHRRSLSTLLGDLAAGGMLGGAVEGTRIALLTGSLGAAERRKVIEDIESGDAGIVIGTHALLEEGVQFADLGLVVVDEQHRFGVEQRAALSDKSLTPPHVLVMTATPIPRTMAMTVFGDLDASTLTELPAGRASIQTTVVPLAEQPAWWQRIWDRVGEEVEQGHQVYVVCPRIGSMGRGVEADETETDDTGRPADAAEDSTAGAGMAVEELAPVLRDGVLSDVRLDVMHGRLPADRKDAVMTAFAAGQIDVLVSTTVIEVGVDVANATTMVVVDADRFGVSQLHQMRGRVGRGSKPGLCLLVTRAKADTPARSRLDAVASTSDGVQLSRLDLAQRREGDVLGASQSGHRSGLRLLSVLRDEEVILAAREAATRTVEADPELADVPDLSAAVRRLDESDQATFLERA
ncbi:MAG TPA: ATP-dependent DNA helicase RecG [Nocardioidaceae bacterium]|nr:ATP-dependent DNA helicase RecG [Nocardioidaceae bacterium]